MATFRLLKSEVKPLTPDLATEFRDMDPSPTERDINPTRIKHLREKAEAGQLVTFHWARARMGDQVLRVNGQHSSNMLSEMNGSFPKGLYVHLDDYEVDGPEGLGLLFRQFDDKKSARSSLDVSGAFQNLYPALQPVNKKVGKLALDGYVWHCRTIEGTPVPSGDSVYSLFNEQRLHPFILWLNDVFSIKTPELARVPVVAAMYATFTANEAEARNFWAQVAAGGKEYDDNAPSTILDGWLKSAKEEKLKEPLKPGEFYQGCIYAWNAYREEKSIKDIRHDTRKSWLNPIG